MKMFSSCIFLVAIFSLWFLPGCKNHRYEEVKRRREVSTLRKKRLDQPLSQIMHAKQSTKRFKDMNLEEALEARAYYKELEGIQFKKRLFNQVYYEETNCDETLLFLIPHIISLSQDVNLIAELKLELADLHLAAGDLDEAQKLYTDFISLYPGNKQIKSARYRQLLTLFWSSLAPDRDQSTTVMAIDEAKKYLQDFPQDAEYTEKVHEILQSAYRKLLESELSMVRFYLNKFQYERKSTAIEAARLRLGDIKEKLVSMLGSYDYRARDCAKELAVIDKIALDDHDSLTRQIQHIAQQVARLEALLRPVDQVYVIHPRDTF